jgi:molecular chaperone DnaK
MKPDARDQRWLVYDLGGGTFDIAIVSTREGQLSVLEHRGNNMLGGMDFDRLMVMKLLWPRLQTLFKLPEASRAIPNYRRLIQILHREAEQAKIDLSFSQQVTLSIFNAGNDDDGKAIETEFEVTRAELNQLVTEPINRTLALCQQAIADARINKADIAKIILVGGPTQMPIVREMLETELNLPLDFSIDPMTVVARGAAIYASTLPITKDISVTTIIPGVIRLTLAHEQVWPETTCLVAGRIDNFASQQKLEVLIEPITGHWTSGWLPVQEGYFETNVQLLEGRTVKFQISLRDEQGRKLPAQPDSFSIRHGLALSEPPLPHSIGAEFVRPDGKTEIEVIFPRSTPLPAQTIISCKADKTLRPSRPEEYIAIKIWEGESPDPESNTWVCALKISATDLPRPLPEGSDIELSIAINASRLMEVEAFVPALNQHFREGVYIPEESKEQVTEKVKLLRFEVDRYFRRLRRLREMSNDLGKPEFQEELKQLSEKLENQDLAQQQPPGDPGSAKILFEEFRVLRARINDLERKIKSEMNLPALVKRLEREKADAEWTINSYGDAIDRKEFELLMREVERHIAREDERALNKAIDDFNDLRIRVLLKQDWVWKDIFESFTQPYVAFSNESEAKRLIEQGHEAIAREDWLKLRDIVEELSRLLPRDVMEVEREKALKAGIRRR